MTISTRLGPLHAGLARAKGVVSSTSAGMAGDMARLMGRGLARVGGSFRTMAGMAQAAFGSTAALAENATGRMGKAARAVVIAQRAAQRAVERSNAIAARAGLAAERAMARAVAASERANARLVAAHQRANARIAAASARVRTIEERGLARVASANARVRAIEGMGAAQLVSAHEKANARISAMKASMARDMMSWDRRVFHGQRLAGIEEIKKGNVLATMGYRERAAQLRFEVAQSRLHQAEAKEKVVKRGKDPTEITNATNRLKLAQANVESKRVSILSLAAQKEGALSRAERAHARAKEIADMRAIRRAQWAAKIQETMQTAGGFVSRLGERIAARVAAAKQRAFGIATSTTNQVAAAHQGALAVAGQAAMPVAAAARAASQANAAVSAQATAAAAAKSQAVSAAAATASSNVASVVAAKWALFRSRVGSIFGGLFSIMSIPFKMLFDLVGTIFTGILSIIKRVIGTAISIFKIFAAGTVFALGYLIYQSAKFGMHWDEVMNMFQVTLGDSSAAVEAWSKATAQKLQLSFTTVMEQVGYFALLAQSIGMTKDQAVVFGKGLSQLAIDISSILDIPLAEAAHKVQSGMMGLPRSLMQLGISLHETTVKEWALNHGFIKQGDQLSFLGKVYMRYGLILEATKQHQGDMQATMGSATNRARSVAEAYKDLRLAIYYTTIKGEGFKALISSVRYLMKALIDRIYEMAKNPQIWATIQGALGKIGESIASADLYVQLWWDHLLQVWDVLKGMATNIGPILKATWAWIANSAKPVFDYVSKLIIRTFQDAMPTAIEAFTTIVEPIKLMFVDIGDYIAMSLIDAFTRAIDFFADGISKIQRLVGASHEKLGGIVKLIPGMRGAGESMQRVGGEMKNAPLFSAGSEAMRQKMWDEYLVRHESRRQAANKILHPPLPPLIPPDLKTGMPDFGAFVGNMQNPVSRAKHQLTQDYLGGQIGMRKGLFQNWTLGMPWNGPRPKQNATELLGGMTREDLITSKADKDKAAQGAKFLFQGSTGGLGIESMADRGRIRSIRASGIAAPRMSPVNYEKEQLNALNRIDKNTARPQVRQIPEDYDGVVDF